MKIIRHIGIVTNNLNKSLYFYKNLLGFKVVHDRRECSSYAEKLLGIKKVDLRTIKLSDSKGALLELVYYKNPKAKKNTNRRINNVGCSHFAVTVDDVSEEYRKLKRKGVYSISPPQESPNGCAKVVFCKDPNGVFVELVEVLNKRKRKK